MTPEQANPVAQMLLHAYLETAAFSRGFLDDYDQPPTLLAKAHHLRAVLQASVNKSDDYRLGDMYAEFGRVQIEDRATRQHYLLRSEGAVSIEEAKRQGQLFNPTKYLDSAVVLLVYGFHREGLDLAFAGTRYQVGRDRLEATGPPAYIGTWPYVPAESESFDQQGEDPFGDVGDIGDDEEEGEG
jgi:hypothetical protein